MKRRAFIKLLGGAAAAWPLAARAQQPTMPSRNRIAVSTENGWLAFRPVGKPEDLERVTELARLNLG